jgi:hypothetical protein
MTIIIAKYVLHFKKVPYFSYQIGYKWKWEFFLNIDKECMKPLQVLLIKQINILQGHVYHLHLFHLKHTQNYSYYSISVEEIWKGIIMMLKSKLIDLQGVHLS